jgi:uncharacterized membrane protein
LCVIFALAGQKSISVEQKTEQGNAATPQAVSVIDDSRIEQLLDVHCANCHARDPSAAGFVSPAGGLVFETLDQFRQSRRTAFIALTTGYMPLGNLTALSSQDRQLLLEWLGLQEPE